MTYIHNYRSYERMCCGKTRRTEDEARALAEAKGDDWTHYFCTHCGYWHRGHKPFHVRELELWEAEAKAA